MLYQLIPSKTPAMTVDLLNYYVADPYSGGSTDWARAVAGIKYTYGVELRDKGT